MLHHHVGEVSMESTNVYSTSQAMCIALLAILRLHVFPKSLYGKRCVQLKEYLRKVFIVNERFCEKCSLRMNTFGYTLTSYYVFQTSTNIK